MISKKTCYVTQARGREQVPIEEQSAQLGRQVVAQIARGA